MVGSCGLLSGVPADATDVMDAGQRAGGGRPSARRGEPPAIRGISPRARWPRGSVRRRGVGADMAHGATLGPPVPEVDPQPLGEATSVGPLAVRPFRWLFGGQAASMLGDRLDMVAMPFAVLSVDGAGAADVGLVLGAGALSLGGFVLIGGVWADRLPRRATMLSSDVARAVLQAVAATLLLTGHATVP